MFILDIEDPDEAERHSAEAWTLARRIVSGIPPADWPELPPSIPPELTTEVRRLLNEIYFYGLLYCAATTQASPGVNGLMIRFPALGGTDGYSDRLVSFETLLPFVDRDTSEAEAQALAARFRGLAAICDDHAEQARRR